MKQILLSILGVAALAVTANAQITAVKWGQSDSYVTEFQNLNGWNSTGATFSTNTARSPSSGYSAPSGLSGIFYGGGTIVTNAGTGSFAQHRIGNNQADGSNYDTIRWQATWSGTSVANDQRFISLVMFQKPDFLNGLNTGTISISGSELYSIRGQGATSFSGGSTTRIVVQNGSDFFISSSVGAYNVSSYTTYSGNFSSLSWFNFDPASSMATVGSSATPTFNNVQSVGFHLNMGSTGASGNNVTFQFNSFTITAVPEPSTVVAALGLTGLLLWPAARRLRRNRIGGAA